MPVPPRWPALSPTCSFAGRASLSKHGLTASRSRRAWRSLSVRRSDGARRPPWRKLRATTARSHGYSRWTGRSPRSGLVGREIVDRLQLDQLELSQAAGKPEVRNVTDRLAEQGAADGRSHGHVSLLE